MMNNNVMVSVFCLAYNHEKYIRDCLDGFVNQKTNFKFEVIVHDDASTDNTANIIRDYAEKYPDFIKPIFQKVNQYSKGGSIVQNIIYPKLVGKYVACCEGDDYWCDLDKLQKQVDIMEANPEYVACVHPTKVINYLEHKESLLAAYDKDCVVKTEDVLFKMVPIFHTTSIFHRRDILIEHSDIMNLPYMAWDYSKLIYLSVLGDIYYINSVMSVYRSLTEGSWTLRTKNRKNRKANLDFPQSMIEALKKIDIESNYRYHKLIDKNILEFEYQVWRVKPRFNLLWNKRIYNLGVFRTIKMIFRSVFSLFKA